MFVVKFVEYMMTKELDVRHCTQQRMEQFRYNTYVQLYTHGVRKRADIYRSDDE